MSMLGTRNDSTCRKSSSNTPYLTQFFPFIKAKFGDSMFFEGGVESLGQRLPRDHKPIGDVRWQGDVGGVKNFENWGDVVFGFPKLCVS